MTAPNISIHDADEQWRSVLHALAQPVATAGFATEAAMIMAERGDTVGAHTRLQTARAELAAASHALRTFMNAAAPRAPDFTAVALAPALALAGLNCAMPPLVMILADAVVLGVALTGLGGALQALQPALALEADSVTISLTGRAGDMPLVSFWLRVLSRAGCRLQSEANGQELALSAHFKRVTFA